MEIDKKHIVGKVWVNLCRFLLGALFIFSGFVKAVDPLGFFYKIQDYLTAFGMISWFPSYAPLLVGIVLSAIEFSVGVFLFLGIRRKVASALALLLMVVMTPLTLYLALANPVSDCGCFGDAWILTNWQTFGKNVVLLVAAVCCIQVAGFTGTFHYSEDGVDDFHVYVSICVCVVLLLPGEFADT